MKNVGVVGLVCIWLLSVNAASGEDPVELPADPRSRAEPDEAPKGSAFIRQDHRGVVDQLIQDEQARYARENAKPEPEPEPDRSLNDDHEGDNETDFTGFDLNSGPMPYFQPRSRPQQPYYVGVFGQPGAYRVEVYYQGSVMDYAVGDQLPGGYTLTGVRSQYITVTSEGEGQPSSKRLYLTSRQAVDVRAEQSSRDSDSAVNDLPPGLLR